MTDRTDSAGTGPDTGDAEARKANPGHEAHEAEPDGAEPDGAEPDAGATGTASPEAEGAETSGGKAKKKARRVSRELLIILVAAIGLTVLLKLFVVQVYEIPSASMQNTLMPGDRVLVNKVVYHLRGIHRGDIVVFSGAGSWGNLDGETGPAPSSDPVVRLFDDFLSAVGLRNDSTYYIKRVIGLPGDHVACCTNGLVTVNGVALHETSYLYPGAAPSLRTFNVTVGRGELFVMGDNRPDSLDSRYQGTIPENEVVGRAFWIIWPFSRFGDLPIPATFQQTALNAGAAGLIAAPLVLACRRRRRRSRDPFTPPR